jgi:CheY-like chemotaxis protein
MVKQALTNDAFDVAAFSSGDQAARELEQLSPDLVIADVFMPGLNGYELCQIVKTSAQLKNTPVLLLVGSFEPFDSAMAARVGADAHITKPFQPGNFAEIVRGLLNGDRSRGYSAQPAAPSPGRAMWGGGSSFEKQSVNTSREPAVASTYGAAGSYCRNHPDALALNRCAACAELFCGACLAEIHGQRYCGSCKVTVRGQAMAAQATRPCKEASDALKYAIVGVFCFGIIFGPMAIYNGIQARKAITNDPHLTGSGKANAAMIIGSIVVLFWLLGMALTVSTFDLNQP